jgi:hypothetical protein
MLQLLLLALLAANCGVERRPVKTLADNPGLEKVVLANVTALRALPAPKTWGNSMPRLASEHKVYRIKALLLGYKLEADQDYHLVLAELGKPKVTMIAEIPSAECAQERAEKFTKERAFVESIHKPEAVGKMVWFQKPVEVVITGVLFWDKIHGQTGVAPNGIELHPVLAIERAR